MSKKNEYKGYGITVKHSFDKKHGDYYTVLAKNNFKDTRFSDRSGNLDVAKGSVFRNIDDFLLSEPLPKGSKVDAEDLFYIKQNNPYSYAINPYQNTANLLQKGKFNNGRYVHNIKGRDFKEFMRLYKELAEKAPNTQAFYKKLIDKAIIPGIDKYIKSKNLKLNPENLQFDYMIISEGRNKTYYVDKNYHVIEDFYGIDNYRAEDTVVKNHPGKIIAKKEAGHPPYILGVFPGIKHQIPKEMMKEEFTEKIKDQIADSLVKGTSVLLDENKGVNYSFNATKGKPFTGVQQLYFQQIKKDNKYENNYFAASDKHLSVKTKEKGVILGDYDSRSKCLYYQFYYNFDQLYNVENSWFKLGAVQANNSSIKEIKDFPVKTDKDLQQVFQDNLTKYFHSIFTGSSDYKPDHNLQQYNRQIAENIKNNSFPLFSMIQNAQKLATGTSETIRVQREREEQRQRTQNHSRGRNR